MLSEFECAFRSASMAAGGLVCVVFVFACMVCVCYGDVQCVVDHLGELISFAN